MYKKGSKTGVNNYRPISLLPVMLKFWKKLSTKDCIYFYAKEIFSIDINLVLEKKHSTNNALTVRTENVAKAFEEKNIHCVFLGSLNVF